MKKITSKGEREKERENLPWSAVGREVISVPNSAATPELPSSATGVPIYILLEKGHKFRQDLLRLLMVVPAYNALISDCRMLPEACAASSLTAILNESVLLIL